MLYLYCNTVLSIESALVYLYFVSNQPDFVVLLKVVLSNVHLGFQKSFKVSLWLIFCFFQPHRKKKAFIDKKKAVTFHLVHRSQKDPLAADEKAPQHVLLPATKVQPCCSDHKSFYSCSQDVCLMIL